MKISMDLLALAYELRCEGCSWRNIAIGLGLNPQTLERAIIRLTEEPECKYLNASLAGGLRC